MIPRRDSVLHRLPVWIKLGLPLALLLVGLLVLAAWRVLQEQVPPHAQLPAIQQRFPQQLAFLRRLADEMPEQGCAQAPQEMMQEIQSLSSWWQQVEDGKEVLSHPAVLGAEVMRYCSGRELGYVVREYSGPQDWWSPSMFFAPEEYPAVSLWHSGDLRVVRYEDRLPGADGVLNGYRLTLDPDRIDAGGGSAEALPGGEAPH